MPHQSLNTHIGIERILIVLRYLYACVIQCARISCVSIKSFLCHSPFWFRDGCFSYETINKDVLEKAAKRFKYRYDILYGAKFDAIENGNEEEYADEAWLKRRKVYLEETDAVKRKESEIKFGTKKSKTVPMYGMFIQRLPLSMKMLHQNHFNLIPTNNYCKILVIVNIYAGMPRWNFLGLNLRQARI